MSLRIKTTEPRTKPRVQTSCGGVSRTKQEFKDECNINLIRKRWMNGGDITHLAKGQPTYGDHMNSMDYREKLNGIIAADEAFESLPSEIRQRFHNDPVELLEFVEDPENIEEGRQLGLFAPEAEQPPKTPPIPEPTPEPPETPPAP